MADKPRKRKPNASCSEASSKDYHAVDIADPTPATNVRWRRSSACNSNSSNGSNGGSRTESWMTKVTSAMSHRIFPGKKLGASRSTQVMPLAAASAASTPVPGSATTAVGESVGSGGIQDVGHHGQDTKVPKLRHVSSENSLARTPSAEPATAMQVLTPVEKVTTCSSVVYGIAADDSDDGDNDSDYRRSGRALATRRQQPNTNPSILQSIQVRKAGSRRVNSVTDKVVPRDQENDDSYFDIDTSSDRRAAPRSMVALAAFGSASPSSSCRPSDEAGDVTDTAPILKDFFSRSASIGQGLRVQQRESRRETMYKNSFQRQECLRQRVEAESHALETKQRRMRVEQLQRATLQRRMHLRREAATARKHLVSRLERDESSFELERERWECDFEDEMQVLSRAFHKASAKTTHLNPSAVDTEEASSRPMTVAGLCVPEALSQIRRDASNYEKRLKTAAPRMLHRDLVVESCGFGVRRERGLASQSLDVFPTDSARDRGDDDQLAGNEDDYEAILCSEGRGSNDEDVTAMAFGFLSPDDTESLVDDTRTLSTVEELLDERRGLLRRIAELEKLVVPSSCAASQARSPSPKPR